MSAGMKQWEDRYKHNDVSEELATWPYGITSQQEKSSMEGIDMSYTWGANKYVQASA